MDPLPLTDLKAWLSDESYRWIEEDDINQAKFQKELEEEASPNLFGDDDSDSGIERVQEWRSSSTHPDGVGGFHTTDGPAELSGECIAIKFILSESYEGFGDTLWASARHVANLLADPGSCSNVLKLEEKKSSSHPLLGKSIVELGAGAGVPSWTAMKCGARVVSTDLASANRIRCMAECIERNYRDMKLDDMDANGSVLQNADHARAAPCPWGKPVEAVLALNGHKRFDVLVAADCCYMPLFHDEMLDTIANLLDDNGVALIPFALHGNTKDESVWGIVEKAKDKGFSVEQLPTQQLSPPCVGMEKKQGLVHTLRLTWK